MSNKPQIILFAPSIHSGGGTERVLVNLANEMNIRGFDITICVNVIGNNPLFLLRNSIKVKTFWYGHFRKKFFGSLALKVFNKLFGIVFWEFFLRKVASSKNVLIISFSNGITLECYKTTYGKKLIAFEHWPFWITEKYPKLQKKIKSVYPKLKKIIVLTQHEKNVYNSINCNNVEIIPNAYSFFPKEPSKLNSKLVLSIGHFNDQKRRDLLIQAWKWVAEKNPDWCLIIIGDGKDRDKIEAEIELLGLKKSIQIINPTPAIQPYYLNSSIFVLSSEFESFSLVLQEAKLSGVPCVCFDVISGPAEVINNGKDGFLIPFPHIKEMADKINLLIENESLRKEFGSFGRADALDRYNPERIYAIWQDFLTQASIPTL